MKRLIVVFFLICFQKIVFGKDLEKLFLEADAFALKNFDSCMSLSNEGILIAQKNTDENWISSFKVLKGKAHYFNGQYDSAAWYYNEAIPLLEKNKATHKLAFAYTELAKLYRRTNKFDNALENYNKAILIYEKLNDLTGISTISNESGVVFEMQKNYNEALIRYQKSYEISLQNNDKTGQAYALNFIGNIYVLKKEHSKATDYFQQAIELHKIVKDTFALAWCMMDESANFIETKKYDYASKNLNQVLGIANQLKLPDLISKIFFYKAQIDSLEGNFKEALINKSKYQSIKDSLFNTDNNKVIEELNTKYQTSKKELLIDEQKNNLRIKNILLVASLLLLGLAILLGYSYFQRRKLKEQKHLQSEILKQQDLSTKAVIEAEEKERVRIAADLHDGIGQLLSAAKMNLHAVEENFTNETQKNILEKAISLVDESAKEIRSVSHNIMPNALIKSGLGFAVKDFIQKLDNKKLQVNVNATGLNAKLNTNIEIVVYRIIQECVNNVIKHSKANRLDISLINENDFLEIMIEDNGVGFDVQKALNKDGIGLKNIKTRVEYLKGTLDIDSKENNGTMMAIHIPLKENML